MSDNKNLDLLDEIPDWENVIVQFSPNLLRQWRDVGMPATKLVDIRWWEDGAELTVELLQPKLPRLSDLIGEGD